MRILTLSSSKGGVGKTTLTASLAVEAARRGEKVALLDLDPQGSLHAWWERRGSPESMPCELLPFGTLPRIVEDLEADGNSLLIIDTPPALIRIIKPAVEIADLVVIPVRPSLLDIEAVEIMDEIASGQGTQPAYVVNAAPTQGSSAAQTVEALEQFGHVFSTVISQRIAHVKAMSKGCSGAELDDAPAREIAALWREISLMLPKVRS